MVRQRLRHRMCLEKALVCTMRQGGYCTVQYGGAHFDVSASASATLRGAARAGRATAGHAKMAQGLVARSHKRSHAPAAAAANSPPTMRDCPASGLVAPFLGPGGRWEPQLHFRHCWGIHRAFFSVLASVIFTVLGEAP